MRVTFSRSAFADITLFGDVALRLLKMMGHSGTIPSPLLADDVPAALARLEAAIEAGNSHHGRLKYLQRTMTSSLAAASPTAHYL